jgi:uncharacterized protein (TIGR02271 family)
MTTIQELRGWIGHDLVDRDGDKIGVIVNLYTDDESGQPTWLTVKTGMFGMRSSFVPLSGTDAQGDVLVSQWDKTTIKDAPNVDADEYLSPQEEQELWRHYGMDYGMADASARGDIDLDRDAERGTVGHDTSGPTTDDAMTRSEEDLQVEKTSREAGRARLRKWVETEHEAVDVPVTREEVRVEREPITEANVGKAMDGPEISEEEHEVVLMEDEVVATTEVTPKERVRLDKTQVTETERVEADLRKERVEVESDQPRR